MATPGWLARLLPGGGDAERRRRAEAAQVAAEEARERKAGEERAARCRALEATLAAEPFAGWMRRGALPDYREVYRRLVETRDTIERLAHEREEIELAMELGIRRLLDAMLDAFLRFVGARTAYLEILVALERQRPAPPPPAPEPAPAVPLRRAASALDRLPFPFAAAPEAGAALPDAARLASELGVRIARLAELAEKEPASVEARAWHVGILEEQRALLTAWARKDQAVVAQLEAFPDAFNVVLGRVGAAQVDAGEVSATIQTITQRVEETERFVKSFAPAMSGMLGGGRLEPRGGGSIPP